MPKTQEEILQEIRAAFADVTREGATTWGEPTIKSIEQDRWTDTNISVPESLGGPDKTWSQLKAESEDEDDEPESTARYHDRDRRWEDLIDDPEWSTSVSGGFSYLEPVACRYYLPAAMVRSVMDSDEVSLASTLNIQKFPELDVDLTDRFIERWSALTDHQRRAVKHLVEFKVALEDAFIEELRRLNAHEEALLLIRGHQPWRKAFHGYWEKVAG